MEEQKMKAKKLLSMFLVGLLIFSASAAGQTEDTATTESVDPGTTPDSFWYFIDVILDNLALALTFDTDDKITKEFEIAEERLSEILAMAEIGDFDAMVKAEEEHGKMLGKIKVNLVEIENGDSEEELEKEIKIEAKIKDHSKKVEDLKDDLRISIQIKGDLTAEQQALIDSVLADLEGQTDEIEVEIKNEKNKTKIKIEIETGKSGDEVEIELEDELGITEDEREDALEEIQDAEEEITKADEDIVDAKEDGKETALSEETLQDAREKLNQAKEAFDEGNFEEAESLADESKDLASVARMKYLGKTTDEVDDGDDADEDETEDDDDEDEDDEEDEVEDDHMTLTTSPSPTSTPLEDDEDETEDDDDEDDDDEGDEADEESGDDIETLHENSILGNSVSLFYFSPTLTSMLLQTQQSNCPLSRSTSR
jgi:hypothetical protein